MFADAQQQHKENSDFYAPDLSLVQKLIHPGDTIKVCEQDEDGSNGERYWIDVVYIDWPAIHGTVANELICQDRAHGSTIMVESVHIYDFQPQVKYNGKADDDLPNVGSVKVLDMEKGDYDLDPRYDLRNHSPDGFAWGYGGSGPAQLALAILAHATDDKTAQKHYQKYKEGVIAALQSSDWVITTKHVKDWLEANA